jgi:hypothetical protein
MTNAAFVTIAGILSAAAVTLSFLAKSEGRAQSTELGAAQQVQNVPRDAASLFAYLQSGAYKAFVAKESKRHPSAGPHTKIGLDVRVFMNDALAKSLADEAVQHPAGSAVVKEMFSEKGELRGWAVAVKTATDSADGQGWFWYEVKSTTDNRRPVAAANGVGLCSGCHAAGRDFVLSNFPLE